MRSILRFSTFLLVVVVQRRTFWCLSYEITFDSLRGKKILVVGGSGRVGGSVVTQLVRHGSQVMVGGTKRESFIQAQQRWKRQCPDQAEATNKVGFIQVDRERPESFPDQLAQLYDLVIHTAGPFQGRATVPNGVLQACIGSNVPYMDVCDDYCTASAAKAKFDSLARVPCILSTGCWPGVSSLMAKQLVAKELEINPQTSLADLSVDFSFFTAGSGGAGVTLLVATFLILAEEALTVIHGRRRPVPPMRELVSVNFGPIVGNRSVAHLNLLETASTHDYLGVGTVAARFGTAPNYWNALLGLMARIPQALASK